MPSVMLHHPVDAPSRELRRLDERTETRLREVVAPPAPAPAPPLRSLKRTGDRPLLFNGVTVATICGVSLTLPFWYEINLHRTVIDSYLTDVRLFHKAPDQSDLFRVAEYEELDDAIRHLRDYDPACDILPPQDFSRPAPSAAALALAVARLQLNIDQATHHYRALVGELLDALTPKD